MNAIEADVGGTVVKIVAENGKPVTPGQALVVIKQ
jgi:biotin carboxyl carrier protein